MADRRRRRHSSQSCSEEEDEKETPRPAQAERTHRPSECESEGEPQPSEQDSEYESAYEENGTEYEGEEGESVTVDGDYTEDEWIEEERQSGDGEEQPEKSKELDDDEDKKNPAYIPRKGAFYEHDLRTDAEIEKEGERPKKKLWKDDGKWDHDRYMEEQQAPKSREEIIATYGYDIRAYDKPPAQPLRRPRRGPMRGGRLRDYIKDPMQSDQDYQHSKNYHDNRSSSPREPTHRDNESQERVSPQKGEMFNNENDFPVLNSSEGRNHPSNNRHTPSPGGEGGHYMSGPPRGRGSRPPRGSGYPRGSNRGFNRGSRGGPHRGYHHQDRGGHQDRGYHNQDRGYHNQGRGYHNQDRGYHNQDRGYQDRGGSQDHGYPDHEHADNQDRGFHNQDHGGHEDRGYRGGPPDRNMRGNRDMHPRPQGPRQYTNSNYRGTNRSEPPPRMKGVSPEKDIPPEGIAVVIDTNVPNDPKMSTRTRNRIGTGRTGPPASGTERKSYQRERPNKSVGRTRGPKLPEQQPPLEEQMKSMRLNEGSPNSTERVAGSPKATVPNESPSPPKTQGAPQVSQAQNTGVTESATDQTPSRSHQERRGFNSNAAPRPELPGRTKRYSSQRQRSLPESGYQDQVIDGTATFYQTTSPGQPAGFGAPPPRMFQERPRIPPPPNAPPQGVRFPPPPVLQQGVPAPFPVSSAIGTAAGPYNPPPAPLPTGTAAQPIIHPPAVAPVYVPVSIVNYRMPAAPAPPPHYQMAGQIPVPQVYASPQAEGIQVRGGTTYFSPEVQSQGLNMNRSPVKTRPKAAIPIVNPEVPGSKIYEKDVHQMGMEDMAGMAEEYGEEYMQYEQAEYSPSSFSHLSQPFAQLPKEFVPQSQIAISNIKTEPLDVHENTAPNSTIDSDVTKTESKSSETVQDSHSKTQDSPVEETENATEGLQSESEEVHKQVDVTETIKTEITENTDSSAVAAQTSTEQVAVPREAAEEVKVS